MTTLNEDQKKELAREAMALWHFYNTFYRTKMDESEFIIRWLRGEIPEEVVEKVKREMTYYLDAIKKEINK